MPTILRSLQNALPKTDAIHDYDAEPALIAKMIAENRLGRKSGAGFVRLSADRKTRDITDLKTGDYRPMKKVASESLDAAKGDARALMEHPGPGGCYASVVMEKSLAYAAALVPEIADRPDAVDDAMRTGYGWKQGPFELIDRLGAGWLVDRLEARGLTVPAYLALAAAKGRIQRRRWQAELPVARWRRSPGHARRGRHHHRRREAFEQAGGRLWLRRALGSRRRCRLPRVPHQDEHLLRSPARRDRCGAR
jgi:hypothetical protein